jgi:hypothetical protein
MSQLPAIPFLQPRFHCHFPQGSHDALVLDFWVLAWSRTGTEVLFDFTALSNEGSPAALKLHGPGARDVLQIEMNGEPYTHGAQAVLHRHFVCSVLMPDIHLPASDVTG